MHKACYDNCLPDGKVLCTLCPQDCHIPGRMRGAYPECGAPIDGAGMV